MRFSCDSCQARYTIDDDKVRGKILRVRCRQCGNFILLEEQQENQFEDAAQEDDSTRVVKVEDVRRDIEAAPAAKARPRASTKFFTRSMSALSPPPPLPPPPEKAEWFIIVQGEEIGPLTMGDLRTRASNNRLLPRTYAWRDGMPGWERLQLIPELQGLLPVMPSVVHRSQPSPARTSGGVAPVNGVAAKAGGEISASMAETLRKAERERAEAEAREKAEAEAREKAEAEAREKAEAEARERAEAEERDRLAAAEYAETLAREATQAPREPTLTHDTPESSVPVAAAAAELEVLEPLEPMEERPPTSFAPKSQPPGGPISASNLRFDLDEPHEPRGPIEALIDDSKRPVRAVSFDMPADGGPEVRSFGVSMEATEPLPAAWRDAAAIDSAFLKQQRKANAGRTARALLLLALLAGMLVYFGLLRREHHTAIAPPPHRAPTQPAIDWKKVGAQGALSPKESAILSGKKPAGEALDSKAKNRTAIAEATRHEKAPVKPAIAPTSRHPAKAPDLTLDQQAALLAIQSDPARPTPHDVPKLIREDESEPTDLLDEEAADIDPAVLKARVNRVKPGLDNCVTSALQRNPNMRVGKVNVALTVLPAGTVSNVAFDTSSFGETDLGQCLGRVLKSVTLPPFKGDPERAEIPLALGVGD